MTREITIKEKEKQVVITCNLTSKMKHRQQEYLKALILYVDMINSGEYFDQSKPDLFDLFGATPLEQAALHARHHAYLVWLQTSTIKEKHDGFVLFREHRGSLEDSMKTVVSVKSMDELRRHLQTLTAHQIEEIKLEKYGYDHRNNWSTYVVQQRLKGSKDFVVAGFTNTDRL